MRASIRHSKLEETRLTNGSRWPLLIYLHASHTSPDSLHWLGKELVDLADTFPISGHDGVKGFFLLSPGSRIADPWPSNAPGAAEDGTGAFWDEWYRNPSCNLDATAMIISSMNLLHRKRLIRAGYMFWLEQWSIHGSALRYVAK